MKKKLFLLLSILVLSAMVLSACAPSAAEETPAYPVEEQPTQAASAPTSYPVETTTINVATDATWAPFEFIDEATKEPVGFDIDLMNAIAEKAGFEINYTNVIFDSLLAGMKTCQYDAAISAITITEDRKKDMLFSDPYINAGQIVIVQVTNTEINGKDDLSNKTIGVQIATTGAMEAGNIQGAKVEAYDTITDALQNLQNSQIDAVIADYPIAFRAVAKNPETLKTVGDVFTEESYGIAICNQKPELVSKINNALKQLFDEGYLAELETKWLITDF